MKYLKSIIVALLLAFGLTGCYTQLQYARHAQRTTDEGYASAGNEEAYADTVRDYDDGYYYNGGTFAQGYADGFYDGFYGGPYYSSYFGFGSRFYRPFYNNYFGFSLGFGYSPFYGGFYNSYYYPYGFGYGYYSPYYASNYYIHSGGYYYGDGYNYRPNRDYRRRSTGTSRLGNTSHTRSRSAKTVNRSSARSNHAKGQVQSNRSRNANRSRGTVVRHNSNKGHSTTRQRSRSHKSSSPPVRHTRSRRGNSNGTVNHSTRTRSRSHSSGHTHSRGNSSRKRGGHDNPALSSVGIIHSEPVSISAKEWNHVRIYNTIKKAPEFKQRKRSTTTFRGNIINALFGGTRSHSSYRGNTTRSRITPPSRTRHYSPPPAVRTRSSSTRHRSTVHNTRSTRSRSSSGVHHRSNNH